MHTLTLFAQEATQSDSSGAGGVVIFAALALVLLSIVTFWRFFEKAGRPGWASIIPIYNLYIMLKIAGRPGWWLLLYLIPGVNIITHVVVAVDIAKAFKKSTAFGVVGLWLFSFIGFMILGFGSAKYKGVPKH